jgi:hypothetical protein
MPVRRSEAGRWGGIRKVNMVRDPRAAIGEFIWSWMVYGFKGLRYAVSSDYRSRVHAFWRLHPGRRTRGIRQMILGVLLDVVIAAGVALVVASHK